MANPNYDFLSLVRNRKTTFEFDESELPEKDVKYILECARWAASAHNEQPWKLIIIKNKKTIQALIELGAYGAYYGTPKLAIAVVLEEMYSDKKALLKGQNKNYVTSHQYMNIGSIEAYIVLAVEALGYKSAIISMPPEKAGAVLKVPKEKTTLLLIAIGGEKNNAYQKPHVRKQLSEIINYEYYGEK